MNEKISINAPISTVTILIFYAIIAYFIYGNSIDAALTIIALSIISGMVFGLLSLLPILGWIIAILISWFWLFPAMLNMGGIEWTWLITLILVMDIIGGLVVTVAILFALLLILTRR